jgi:hypothetical protein
MKTRHSPTFTFCKCGSKLFRYPYLLQCEDCTLLQQHLEKLKQEKQTKIQQEQEALIKVRKDELLELASSY